MAQKYPRTKAGMRKRRMSADVGQNKQFNRHNGEVHTQKWLEEQISTVTGLFVDSSYLYKILTGQRNAPKVVEAIRNILDIKE
jgi:hypothetical protein